MSGYERCMAAIEGRKPDRIPAYTATCASEVATKILGRPAHTGGAELWYAEAVSWLKGPSAWREFDEKVVEDVVELHRALGWDVIRLPWRKSARPSAEIGPDTFLYGDPEGEHEIWRWDADTRNFIQVRRQTFLGVEDWPRLARKAEAQVGERLAIVRESFGAAEARLQKQVGDSMMVAASGAGLSLGLDEVHLMALVEQPAAVEAILDVELTVGLAQIEALASRDIRVVLGGGDMADKNGPLYSPAMFARFILPRLKRIVGRCRELGLHYVWRSDGKLWKICDMLFLEAAVPGYGEVDFDAGMTTGELRRRYPEVVIWGNVSGDLLRRGTPNKVYDHCMELLECSGGVRYFHGVSNTILPGTPPENIFAMTQARDDFSGAMSGRCVAGTVRQ